MFPKPRDPRRVGRMQPRSAQTNLLRSQSAQSQAGYSIGYAALAVLQLVNLSQKFSNSCEESSLSQAVFRTKRKLSLFGCSPSGAIRPAPGANGRVA